MLAGPSDLVDKLSNMVGAKEDCSNYNSLPKIGFQIGDKVLNLKPDDYMDSSASDCSFSLMSLDVPPPKGPLFIFGDPFLRRFVTIFDRSGPRVGFAVSKHSDDNTPASELIAHVAGGAGASESSSSPATGGDNPSAVNLHLESGLMGPGEGDSSDDSSAASGGDSPAPPAPSPVPPPPPAWVPPPSPPPAVEYAGSSLGSSLDRNDPFGSNSHLSSWDAPEESHKATADDPQKVQSETPAPMSDYEKILMGNPAAASAYTSPLDDAPKKLVDVAPVGHVVAAPESSNIFDAFDGPAAASPTFASPMSMPAATEKPSSPTDTSAFDIWSATKDFDSPAAQPAVAKAAPAQEDSIARMRRLFKQNALLQMQKKGHMVSVKLHRGQ